MSRSFIGKYLECIKVDHAAMAVIASVYKYKGKQHMYKLAVPNELQRLRQNSIIESANHSILVEKVTVPPTKRNAFELRDYKLVLAYIHKHQNNIPLLLETILDFHNRLMSSHPGIKGKWKTKDNVVAGGMRKTPFTTIPTDRVEQEMSDLIEGFNAAWTDEQNNQLVLTAAFVLDFLCIHPFADGNGRMSRLLTHVLLYKAGFQVGRYISLERIIDRTRAGYYTALGTIPDHEWNEGKHNLNPWLLYLSQTILDAYQELENEMAKVTLATLRIDLGKNKGMQLTS